jgi:hypothetical protein
MCGGTDNHNVKENCLDNVCRNYLLGKGCKKGENCKWRHPTAQQLFKQFKRKGGIDVQMMRCHKTPFCLKLIAEGKCRYGNDCCLGHSITAPSLVYWLKKKECLTIEI